MKRKNYTEEQIISILNEAEAGVPPKDLCRKHGMSSATFYAWKRKFAGMDVSDAKRLKALEEENRRLKQMVAELALDNQMLKTVNGKMVRPAARREAVQMLRAQFGVSERRACPVVGQSRSTQRYRPRDTETEGRKCPVNDGWSGGRQPVEPGRHGRPGKEDSEVVDRGRREEGPVRCRAKWPGRPRVRQAARTPSATAVVVAKAARASAERVGRDAYVR